MSTVYRAWLPLMGGGGKITGAFYARRNADAKPVVLECFSGGIAAYEARCEKLSREFSREFFDCISIWFIPESDDKYHPVMTIVGIPLDIIKLSKFEFEPAD